MAHRPRRAAARHRRRANGVAVAALQLCTAPAEDPVDVKRRMVADLCKVIGGRLVGRAPVADSGVAPPAPAPTPDIAALPPRLQQTLLGLLAGDGEKQIARRLQISPHTVHVYVKSLYRRFAVTTRGELLARWVRPTPTPGAGGNGHAGPTARPTAAANYPV